MGEQIREWQMRYRSRPGENLTNAWWSDTEVLAEMPIEALVKELKRRKYDQWRCWKCQERLEE